MIDWTLRKRGHGIEKDNFHPEFWIQSNDYAYLHGKETQEEEMEKEDELSFRLHEFEVSNI